ncbi:unnamed protein product [Prorocentrum cordatum]|uniref:Uncharacterized protein n=1 Tax=Prorocentrum cordatum TaxID=2364126 RepID=A0ABN9WBV8_9DINO|nr:unnamed protein product [Polarella glacialis]
MRETNRSEVRAQDAMAVSHIAARKRDEITPQGVEGDRTKAARPTHSCTYAGNLPYTVYTPSRRRMRPRRCAQEGSDTRGGGGRGGSGELRCIPSQLDWTHQATQAGSDGAHGNGELEEVGPVRWSLTHSGTIWQPGHMRPRLNRHARPHHARSGERRRRRRRRTEKSKRRRRSRRRRRTRVQVQGRHHHQAIQVVRGRNRDQGIGEHRWGREIGETRKE